MLLPTLQPPKNAWVTVMVPYVDILRKVHVRW